MPRYGAIDIGTNSVLLLVGDVDAEGCVTPVVDKACITRLGKSVDDQRRLNPEAIARTLDAVSKYADEARSLGVAALGAAGTSALRDAANADDFLVSAKQALGSNVRVISGEVEADFSWRSVCTDPLLGTDFPLMMADVGGGSSEIVIGTPEDVSLRTSIDVGAVRLTERYLTSDPPPANQIDEARSFARDLFQKVAAGSSVTRLVAIGGTIVNLACVQGGGLHHESVHGYKLSLKSVSELIERFASVPLEQRKSLPGLEPARADVIIGGAVVFQALLEAFGLDELTVSTRGARFGLLLEIASGRW